MLTEAWNRRALLAPQADPKCDQAQSDRDADLDPLLRAEWVKGFVAAANAGDGAYKAREARISSGRQMTDIVELVAKAIWDTQRGSRLYPWETLGTIREDYRSMARALIKEAPETPEKALQSNERGDSQG